MYSLLFDFDGTLFDSNAAHEKAFIHTFQKFQLGPFPGYESIKGQKTTEVLTHFVKDSARLLEVATFKSQYYQSNIQEVKPLFTLPKLIALTEKQFNLYIVSGGSRSSIKKVLDYFQLTYLFKGMITAEDYVHSKPDPECFLNCLKKFHIQGPTKGIEDSIHGIESLKRAGIEAVGVHNPLIKPHANRYFNQLDLFLDELLLIA